MTLKIKNIKGDVIVSNNQSGGVTGKNLINNHFKTYGKFVSVVGIIALFANGAGILDYMNINPFKTTNERKINIQNISGNVVVSENQTGGITAHTVNINNVPKKRDLSSSYLGIIGELKKYPISAYRLHYAPGDPEANNLANQIDDILTKIGWQKIHPVQKIAGLNMEPGINIFILKGRGEETFLALANTLNRALENKGVKAMYGDNLSNIFQIGGWSAPVELPEGRNGVVIFIGPNPEN